MGLKSSLLASTRVLGLQAMLRRHHRHRLLVLCYHGVVSDDHNCDPYLYRNTVNAAEFELHLQSLRTFHPISANQLCASMRGESTLPSRPVLITFDDGYRNNLTLAAKILARHAVPALVSIATDYIGGDRPLWPMQVDLLVLHSQRAELTLPDGRIAQLGCREARAALAAEIRGQCKRLSDEQRRRYLTSSLAAEELPARALADEELWTFMSWDDVRELRDLGVAIASHTTSHPILTRLQPDALRNELEQSKRRIEEELGEACPIFVYPNGGAEDVSTEVVEAVSQAGYSLAFTLMDQINPKHPDPHRIDRISVPGHCSIEAFHYRVSGLRSLLQSLRLP